LGSLVARTPLARSLDAADRLGDSLFRSLRAHPPARLAAGAYLLLLHALFFMALFHPAASVAAAAGGAAIA